MDECSKCGAALTEGQTVCPSCGAAAEGPLATHLRCASCNGVMEWDPEKPNVAFCPYCGSKELICESDKVTIARLRVQRMREAAAEAERREMLREQMQEERDRVSRFETRALSKVILVMFVLSALSIISLIQGGYVLAGPLCLLPTVAFGLAWLMGMGYIKTKRDGVYVILTVVGFLLYLIVAAVYAF